MIGQSIFGSDQQKLRSELASIPYATIGVRVGGGPQTILMLATQRENTLLWTSKSQIVIETQSGRVSRSTGLPHDLAAISDNSGDPLAASAKKLVGATPSSRYVDFTDRRGKHNLVHSVLTPQGREDIEILETSVATVHFVERSFCTTLGWEFVDEFWADYKSGFIWRSVQHIHPDMAAVEIETFRPPAS
jgi:hypothetical protein